MIRNFFLKNNNIDLNVLTHTLDNPDSILIHLHGFGHHFQLLESFSSLTDFPNRIKYFSKLNILSYALELRGHGKSSGMQHMIYSFDEYISDLLQLVEHVMIYHPKLPIYLISESMGGALAIKYSILYEHIAGVILLAPMCGLNENAFNIGLLYLLLGLSYILPTYRYITSNTKSTINEKYYESIKDDKYLNRLPVRLAVGREFYNTMNWINNNNHLFTIPILAIHSIDDAVTDYKTTEAFINNCSSINKTLILRNKGDHYLLVHQNDDDEKPNEVMDIIYKWLEQNNIKNSKPMYMNTYELKYLKYKGKYLSLLSDIEAAQKSNFLQAQTGGGEKIDIMLFKWEQCGWCKKFEPHWNAASSIESLKKKFNFITYDANNDKDKVKEYKVDGYPTIIFKDSTGVNPYDGPRDEGFITFLENIAAI